MMAIRLTLILLLTVTVIMGQEPDHHLAEVHSLKDFFLKGQVNGHMRNSLMATVNEGELLDYWANASGGSIGYHTAEWKGFQLGVKGIFTYNTFSADLNRIDPLTGKSAKWEKELFDVTRPNEKHDLDRLEELYIKYHFRNSWLRYGKVDIDQGPLLLKRDGRMKPFVYRGFWAEVNEIKKTKLYAGWIHGVSPRGMTEWYSLNEAIGLNNNGFQPNGEKADYHEVANTKGLGVLGVQTKLGKKGKLTFWNYYLHRLYNTNWLQYDYKGQHWFGGVQYVFQFSDPYQKSLEYTNRYYQPDEYGHVVSAQVGYQFPKKNVALSAAYLHGFDQGRFLFPRELTRENFYVSQPRSWIDGYGQVDVGMVRAKITPQAEAWKGFSFDVRFERVQAPDITDYAQNKYGASAYFQSTFIMRYDFQKKLEGLHLMLLYVAKQSEEELELSANQRFYKTNLHHLNLIINITF